MSRFSLPFLKLSRGCRIRPFGLLGLLCSAVSAQDSVVLQRGLGTGGLAGDFVVAGTSQQLLIDSGATASGLTRRTLAKLTGESARREPAVIRSLHGSLAETTVVSLPVRWGAAEVMNRFLELPDMARLPWLVSGVLGHDFLQANRVSVDFGRTPAMRGRRRGSSAKNAPEIPLEIVRNNGLLALRTRHERGQLCWLIDSGSVVSILEFSSVRNQGLPTWSALRTVADSSGEKRPCRQTELHGLVACERVPLNVRPFVSTLAKIATYRLDDGTPLDGLLGLDFLQLNEATIDFGSAILFVGK